MNLIKNLFLTLFVILFIYLLAYRINAIFKPQEEPIIKTDTIYQTNTIKVIEPKYMLKEIYVDKVDTMIIHNTDTIKVEIPISQKVYKDSLYTAYVSGYRQNLDSLFIHQKNKIITTEKIIKEYKKGFRFSPYLGVGYGIFSQKPDLQVGFGLTYQF